MFIVPAILTNDEGQLMHQISRLLPHFSLFQIDVQDGQYAPSTTLSLPSMYACLLKIKGAHPEKFSEVFFDFHLMLSDYSEASKVLEDMSKDVNIRYVFVHRNVMSLDASFVIPVCRQAGRRIPIFIGTGSGIEEVDNFPLDPVVQRDDTIAMNGLCPALNPDDGAMIERNATFLGQSVLSYPAIQIMTISPGPQGQAFEQKNLEKIKILRENGYKGEILIDGSVNERSMKQILEKKKVFWPDTLCVGSYLSRAPDNEVGSRVNVLKELAKSA